MAQISGMLMAEKKVMNINCHQKVNQVGYDELMGPLVIAMNENQVQAHR